MIIYSADDDLKRLNSKLTPRGQEARWTAWNIVVFRPDNTAAYKGSANEHGERPVFRNGAYGWERTVEPNAEGNWLV
jgi:hypothetical protein